MKMILAVAAGGAFGAIARYYAAGYVGRLIGADFPFGTLTVNVVGSFLMGVLVEVSALAWSPSPELRAMIAVGFLGAFTTFSTFSLDAVLLFERGQGLPAAAYVLFSVVLSIGAFFLALYLIRTALA
jgi:CrcB protein